MPPSPSRIYSLDYLRGLTAFGIMVFHFTSWTFGGYNAEDFLGRVGLYGVSVFYVLSGLTLYLIYSETLLSTFKSSVSFFIKRIFRIFPLLWLTVFLTLVTNPKLFDIWDLLLSLTGAFGFVAPVAGIGTGVWSIGNELVFYALFPLLIWLLRANKLLFSLGTGLLIVAGIYFAFSIFNQHLPLGPQWETYVNPFNQAILFAAGMLIGYGTSWFPVTNINAFFPTFIFIGSLLLFTFFPASGDRINLVAGWNRLIFLAISILVCGSVYYANYRLPTIIHKPLALTGEISYGLYLLHPIVYSVISAGFKFFKIEIDPVILLLLAFVSTYIFSYLVFRYFETPFINAGKTINQKIIQQAVN